MTQQELAEMAGVSRTAIARLETGEVDARGSTIRKLALALGVAPDELIEPREGHARTGSFSEDHDI